jgi:hypothetical protein
MLQADCPFSRGREITAINFQPAKLCSCQLSLPLNIKELFMDDFLKDLAIFELGRIALAELQYH